MRVLLQVREGLGPGPGRGAVHKYEDVGDVSGHHAGFEPLSAVKESLGLSCGCSGGSGSPALRRDYLARLVRQWREDLLY